MRFPAYPLDCCIHTRILEQQQLVLRLRMSERVHLYDGEHNVIGYHVMQGKPDCRALSLPNSPENSDPYKKSSAHCLWMSKNVIVRSYNNFPATVDMPKSFAHAQSTKISKHLLPYVFPKGLWLLAKGLKHFWWLLKSQNWI